jgi:ferredoxin
MRVSANEKLCISSGQCVLVTDTVFDQHDDDGLVIVLQDRPAPELHDDVRAAARACPVGALLISEE